MYTNINADALLSHYWAGRGLPVDPEAIARMLGANVQPLPISEWPKASGWFRIVGNVPTILYNPSESPTRKRFTIAHELGHYVLQHGERPRDSSSAFNLYNFDPIEAEANKFAAELLMPESTVRWKINRGATSLTQLSADFGVSEVAMKYRLKNLGMLR